MEVRVLLNFEGLHRLNPIINNDLGSISKHPLIKSLQLLHNYLWVQCNGIAIADTYRNRDSKLDSIRWILIEAKGAALRNGSLLLIL